MISERHGDEEDPVGAEAHSRELDGAPEKGGHLDRLLAGAEDVGGGRRGDEHQADREQHLVELAGLVEPAKQRPLEEDADDGRTEKGDGNASRKGKPS